MLGVPAESLAQQTSPGAAKKRSWRFWVIAVTASLAIICFVCVGYAGIEILHLARNDAQAHTMARILAHRIRSRDPAFENVVENISTWHNGHDMPATACERVWNRHYAAIVGAVKTEAELAALRELIRSVCEEYHYDPELVAIRVRVEPK
jgi:hypothetical protein